MSAPWCVLQVRLVFLLDTANTAAAAELQYCPQQRYFLQRGDTARSGNTALKVALPPTKSIGPPVVICPLYERASLSAIRTTTYAPNAKRKTTGHIQARLCSDSIIVR